MSNRLVCKTFFISTVVLTYSYTVLWLSLFIGLFSYQSTHSGLVLNFLGGFEGSADVLHLPNCGAGDGQDMEAAYPKKTKVLQCYCMAKTTCCQTWRWLDEKNICTVFPGHKAGEVQFGTQRNVLIPVIY